jgi:RNA polymerase sigma-70 factor (ECF subfamily)
MEQPTTELLRRARQGDALASGQLMEAVYAELHRIAEQRLRKERPGHTLQPTALVNEAYLRMCQQSSPEFTDRIHFLKFASRVMRHVLVDYARKRDAEKRGGPEQRITLEFGMDAKSGQNVEAVLDLDLAIESLGRESPLPAEVIEMRYFGGMTAEETAMAVGRSIHVVQHELRFAHAWLRQKLAGSAIRNSHESPNL